MIEGHDGKIELVCDGCEIASGDIAVAGDAEILRADAKSRGWRRYRLGLVWHDSCAQCVAKWAAKKRGQGALL